MEVEWLCLERRHKLPLQKHMHSLCHSAGIQQQNSVKISLHDTLIKTVKQETDKKPVLNQMRK